MIAVVIWQHAAGSLPQRFSRLGTGIGLVLFAGLWACTWLATRWGLRTQADARIAPAAWGPPIIPTIVAGGWNGLMLFVPVMGTFVTAVLAEGERSVLQMLTGLLLGTTIGGAVAFAVGAIVGFLYGVTEALLLGLSDRIHQWATR